MIITHLITDPIVDKWDTDTGQPTVVHFSNAVQVWAWAQGRTVTVAEAAKAFNVAAELIREAVEWHCWMFLGADDTIQHEGE